MDPFSSSSSSSSDGLRATKKRTVTIASGLFGAELVHGVGEIRYHGFQTGKFESVDAYNTYANRTGLKETDSVQEWGGGKRGTLRRSRRGSISGMSRLSDGSVQAFRWSSYPTTVGINAGVSDMPHVAYDTAARHISTEAKNSVGKSISPNAILSDKGRIHFHSDVRGFTLQATAHSQGLSGAGMDYSKSSSPEDLYRPGIETAIAHGKTPTPASTRHSEPMGIALMEDDAGVALRTQHDITMMTTSIPNQVCVNCGRTYLRHTGPRAHVSGMPGVKFGGQKPGQIGLTEEGPRVFRATPSIDLLSSKENRNEVDSIFVYHRGSKALMSAYHPSDEEFLSSYTDEGRSSPEDDESLLSSPRAMSKMPRFRSKLPTGEKHKSLLAKRGKEKKADTQKASPKKRLKVPEITGSSSSSSSEPKRLITRKKSSKSIAAMVKQRKNRGSSSKSRRGGDQATFSRANNDAMLLANSLSF